MVVDDVRALCRELLQDQTAFLFGKERKRYTLGQFAQEMLERTDALQARGIALRIEVGQGPLDASKPIRVRCRLWQKHGRGQPQRLAEYLMGQGEAWINIEVKAPDGTVKGGTWRKLEDDLREIQDFREPGSYHVRAWYLKRQMGRWPWAKEGRKYYDIVVRSDWVPIQIEVPAGKQDE